MINITVPTLILNEARCRYNIKVMTDKAHSHGIKLRPHFKTHQSLEIGRWFRSEGVAAITVSSVKMAQYFASDGWEEITIAFPVNIRQIDTINELARKVKLNLLVSSLATPVLLEKELKEAVDVYIEVDCGSNRSGFRYDNIDELKAAKEAIIKAPLLNLKGYYSHAGHTYSARSKDDILRISKEAKENFLSLRQIDGDNLEFCWGDTPSCSVWKSFEGINALSPGNFVFYDVMQTQIGACAYKDIAVALGCPVVSKKKEVLEICVHGGAIHFSKDSLEVDGQTIFGVPVAHDTWEPLSGAFVRAISQEHGIVKLSPSDYKKYEVGDVMYILPIHSCLTAEAIGTYMIAQGQLIGHMSKKSRD